MDHTPEARNRPDGEGEIHRAVAKYASNLTGEMKSDGGFLFLSLTIRRNDNYRWLAVAKRRHLAAGWDEVCFGVGGSFAQAIIEVSKAIGGGKWKRDQPWPLGKK